MACTLRCVLRALTRCRGRAGVPVTLKDGDVICLGDSTVLKVSIAGAQGSAPPEAGSAAARAPAAGRPGGSAPTVESFLQAQCETAVTQLQVSTRCCTHTRYAHEC